MALNAALVAKLEDAIEILEDLVNDLEEEGSNEGEDAGQESHDDDPLVAALHVVVEAYESADAELEERLARWLARDPEHWPIFRLAVLDAWQVTPGHWREGVPGWVRALATNAAIAHYQQDPFGRQQVLDFEL